MCRHNLVRRSSGIRPEAEPTLAELPLPTHHRVQQRWSRFEEGKSADRSHRKKSVGDDGVLRLRSLDDSDQYRQHGS